MRMIWLGMVLMAFLQPIWAVGQASHLTQLYTMTVPVADREQGTLDQAVKDAYKRLLVRVSGNLYVNTIPDIQKNLDHATQMISHYAYEEVDGQLRLSIFFNRNLVNEQLEKAGQRLWLQARPDVLLWVAYQSSDDAVAILSEGQPVPWQPAIEQTAMERGIHVVLPMMDLQDHHAVEALDVWQLRQGMAWNASRRYGQADAVMGKVFESEQKDLPWEGIWYWRSVHEGKASVTEFQTYGNDPKQVLTNAVNWLADQMASLGAKLNNPRYYEVVNVHVDGVDGLTAYQRILRLFKADTRVKSLKMVSLTAHTLTLSVEIRGGADALQAFVRDNPDLQALTSTKDMINLAWQPKAEVLS